MCSRSLTNCPLCLCVSLCVCVCVCVCVGVRSLTHVGVFDCFLHIHTYLNVCRCTNVLGVNHTFTHTHSRAPAHALTRTHTHTEQRIQLRSAAHPRLSNILSAQPKNHNWTLWEALIQSTVTMLSETKSTACSQHINSHLTLSPYLSPSLSLSLFLLPLSLSLSLPLHSVSAALSFSYPRCVFPSHPLPSPPPMCDWTSKYVAKADLLYKNA